MQEATSGACVLWLLKLLVCLYCGSMHILLPSCNCVLKTTISAMFCSMSVVRTYCGHGIGEFFHCAPNVPHYAKNKAKGTMKVGEIFTIGRLLG